MSRQPWLAEVPARLLAEGPAALFYF